MDFLKTHETTFDNYPKNQEVLFYGGTFNPWHAGHSTCIELAPADLPLWVVPDRNPFKEISERNAQEEYSKIEEEIRHIKRPHTSIFGNFLYENKSNPTINWISLLSKKYPELRFSLLMGFDSFISLPDWTEAHKLVNTLHAIYVVSRSDDEKRKIETLSTLEKLNPELLITFLGHHDFENLSSTQIRSK